MHICVSLPRPYSNNNIIINNNNNNNALFVVFNMQVHFMSSEECVLALSHVLPIYNKIKYAK